MKAAITRQKTGYRCFIGEKNLHECLSVNFLVEHSGFGFWGMAIAEGFTAIGITNSKEFLIVLKRMLAIMLTGMMLTMAVGFRPATAQSVKSAVQDDPVVAKVRMDVWKLGVGETARVEVKLRDQRKLKGYIGEATNDSFTVVDSKSGSQPKDCVRRCRESEKSRRRSFDAFMDNPRRCRCWCRGYLDDRQARPLRWWGAKSRTLLTCDQNEQEWTPASTSAFVFLCGLVSL